MLTGIDAAIEASIKKLSSCGLIKNLSDLKSERTRRGQQIISA